VHLGKIALAPELAACNAQISASKGAQRHGHRFIE
jgi:hypothetical protein